MGDSWDSWGNRKRDDWYGGYGDHNAAREQRIMEWDRQERANGAYARMKQRFHDDWERRTKPKHPPVPKGVWR